PRRGRWRFAEFGAASSHESESRWHRLMEALGRSSQPAEMRLFVNKQQVKTVWEVRESSLGAISHVPGEPLTWEGWEDSAVAPEKLGNYLRDLRKLMAGYGYRCVL